MYEVEIYLFAETKGPAVQKAWYGYVMEYETQKGELVTREGFGEEEETANGINIKGLTVAAERLKAKCRIQLHTNSRHLAAVISNRWLGNWAESGWKSSSGKEIRNRELWEIAWRFLKVHEMSAVYEKENSYSEWIRHEIAARKKEEKRWEDTKKQMTRGMKGEKGDVLNVS